MLAKRDGQWVEEQMVLDWLLAQKVRISPDEVELVCAWQAACVANAINDLSVLLNQRDSMRDAGREMHFRPRMAMLDSSAV